MSISMQGVAAAAGTVACWTASAYFFSKAGERIGSTSVNIIRLFIALALFAVSLTILQGSPLPAGFSNTAWMWLLVSGITGLFLGDLCLFRAFVEIGPRLTLLIMSCVPPLTIVLDAAFFHESYRPMQIVGMAIAVAGIAWGVAARPNENVTAARTVTMRGVLLAFGGALGQALGIVTADQGMVDVALDATSGVRAITAVGATEIRIIAATIGFAVLFTLTRRWGKAIEGLRHVSGMAFTTAGAIVGPFLGVTLMVLSLLFLSDGVVATIISLTPITIIPVVVLFDREHVSWQAIAGAVVAFVGVTLLVLN